MRVLSTAVALLSLSSVTAFAAPFCMVITGTSPLCMYYDGTQCAKDAARQNGACEPNPNELRAATSNYGDYCMVTPEGASRCGYSDGTICSRDALIQKGVCTKAAGTGPKVRPDQYDTNANN
jgi:hypothetical protein